MAPPPPPPSSLSWVILSTIPRVAMLDNHTDVSLAPLAAPPCVTLLNISPRVLPSELDLFARLKLPYIHAADPSGLLLAITPPLPSPPPSSTTALSDDNEGDGVVTDTPRPDYRVFDVPSATATSVPDPNGAVYNWINLGVIAAPDGAPGFMIAEFNHDFGCEEATLTCFSSETGQWVDKDVENPLPSRIWIFDDVISHDAKLWWVDAAEGLVAFDPFADAPEMVYVPLPEQEDDDESDHASCYGSYEGNLGSRRYVNVSNGKFRCVDMTRARQGQGGAPTVTMRTLVDPETAEWTLEYEVRFDEIWADDTYKASRLPEEAPMLAVIHPENPDVLYFFVEVFPKDYLFGVDMRARKVVGCEAYEPARGTISLLGVLALVLPPALAAGLPVEVSHDGVKEDESGSPPSDSEGL